MHCTTSVNWYIGKFVFNFFLVLFLYEGFLKEKPIDCVCGAGARDLARQRSGKEPPRSRCICKHWRKAIYPCGCKRKAIIDQCAGRRPSVSHNPDDSKKKPSCCCGH
ncbi:uncharacterized protein [Chelonus insularis]|uniref:uncharacterized protein n=1 Tax=Chelonus insularis TaxID=460826 RepID=UPI00158DCDFE|nr:uncharacterized protein LOC118063666 [Chelonus insularis]